MLFKLLLLSFAVGAICAKHNKNSVTKTDSSDINKDNETISLLNIREQLKKGKPIPNTTPKIERNPEFWKELGRQEVENNLKKQHLNKNVAKNIIFFLGDGMSVSTITAARILKGQRNQETGEEQSLSFEKFPYTGLSKTYCTNAQVADSSCSATAYLCGVKETVLTVGVNANVTFNDCPASMDKKNHVSSIAKWAQKAGKSTGFVTTSSVTDASPSGLYAHVSNRFFESDKDVKQYYNDSSKCKDIADQLVNGDTGSKFDVIMGGGRSKFLPSGTQDGIREDGKNLLETWQTTHPQGALVSNRDELFDLNLSEVSQIMGIFHSVDMDYNLKANVTKQPTLAEMTETALKLLQKNDNGYFIFIEGALIDKAHHETKAEFALDETLELEKAVQLARDMTDPEDTLIVVTSDHAHPLSIMGYPIRGADILGVNKYTPDGNNKKYFTLSYAMGPQQYLDKNGSRWDANDTARNPDFQYPAYIHSNKGQHSGEDVPIYASGPYDFLFTGVMEQSTIPHAMAYAGGFSEGTSDREGVVKIIKVCFEYILTKIKISYYTLQQKL